MHRDGRDLFFDGSPFAALLLDTTGHVVSANPRARTLLARLDRPSGIGVACGNLFDASGRIAWSVAMQELGADGTVEPMMMRLVSDSAAEPRASADVLLAATAWPDESGARAAIVVTLVDVAQRLQVTHDIQVTADRYRSIMETARDAILLLDSDGRVNLVNGAARELFEGPGNSLIGRPVADLLEGEAARAAFEAALMEMDAAAGPAQRLALRCRGISGQRVFPAEVGISRFRTSSGPRHTVIVRDETERLALHSALEHKARELAEKNEELEAFSYSVSHALKAPLRTMGNFAGLLYSRYREQLDDTGARYLSFLVDTCNEQSKQVEQLLEMSRLSRSEDAFEEIAVGPIVARIVDYHVLNAADRDIDVTVSLELPTMQGQRAALHHLFDNLIGNAIKFTGREARATVEVGYARQEDEHHFWVSDNGIGIAQSDEETIFRLFGRLHRQEEFEGTGAGLNIVTKILERHGGRIHVDSTLGEGTTFHVRLPVEPTRRRLAEP